MSKQSTDLLDNEAFLRRALEIVDTGMVPTKLFNNPGVYELEVERIYGKTWNFMAHQPEIHDEKVYRSIDQEKRSGSGRNPTADLLHKRPYRRYRDLSNPSRAHACQDP